MSRLIREPLLHFALLGAVIFAGYSLVSDRRAVRSDEIVVSAGKIAHLATLFERTWQRPPTPEELEEVVREFVREEAAYREAVAAGLDRDDTIIRRRLRQKLEFLAEDFASAAEPSDAELHAYLESHADAFRLEPLTSFRQVFLDPEAHGDELELRARELRIALNGEPTLDAASLGDRILHQDAYVEATMQEVADLFGARFAIAIRELEPGSWSSAIPSSYGVHLVHVDARVAGRMPALDEVRAAVRREWDHARRQETTEAFYREMLERYEIRIEWPEQTVASPDELPATAAVRARGEGGE